MFSIAQFGITKLKIGSKTKILLALRNFLLLGLGESLYKKGATRLDQEPVVQTMTGTSHWINPHQIEIQFSGLAGSVQSTGERFIHLTGPSIIVTAVVHHQYIIYLNVLAIMPSRWQCYSSKCDRTLQRHLDGCLFYTVIITASSR